LSQKTKLPAIREKKVKRSSNRKLLTLLFVFFIIILLVLFFNSSFSRIETIEIRGEHYLSAEEIGQALLIKPQDQFFAVSTKKLELRVKQLKIIESVKVTKNFPGHILIEVNEYPEVAYQITPDGKHGAVLANGSIVQINDQKVLFDKPILTGWSTDDPVKIKLSQVLATIPQEMLDDISEIKPIPSVSYPDKIKLYTRSYFEIITTVEYLPEKLSYLDEMIADLKQRNITTGVLTLLLADTHAPFEMEETDKVDD
jgi:cell division protein FtsQ